jgi:hypothetical protein
LDAAKKKCEDKQKGSTEANGVQRQGLGRLKDKNKGRKAKEDRLVEEVGKQKEEIRPMAAKHHLLVKELVTVKDLLNKLPPPKVAPLPPKYAPVKVSLPPGSPKQTEQFPQ